MFIYLHKAPFFSQYTFFKLSATKAAMTCHLKENLATFNKSEHLYFSDNDNEHKTGEQAHPFPTILLPQRREIHAQYALSGVGGHTESVGWRQETSLGS